MAATLDFDLPTETFTNISSTLIGDTIYSLQNRSANPVELIERAALPADADIGKGVYLNPREQVPIKRVIGFEIYARPVYSIGKVVIGEAV